MANPSNDFDRVIQYIIIQRDFPPMTRISNMDIARYVEKCPKNRKPHISNILKANYRLADAVTRGILTVESLGKVERYQVFRLEDPEIFRRSVVFERVQENGNGRIANGHS